MYVLETDDSTLDTDLNSNIRSVLSVCRKYK